MCYLRPIITAVDWQTTVNICHAMRSSEPPVFTNSVSIAHVPTLIVIAFFIENTTMDAVSRCISCGFPNRRKQLLETTRASFSSITVYNKDYVRSDGRQKHNSTENPEISVLLAYNMKLFTAKVKRAKKLQPENRRKPRNKKKTNKNRIRNIKIIASKRREKDAKSKNIRFFQSSPRNHYGFPEIIKSGVEITYGVWLQKHGFSWFLRCRKCRQII